MHTHTHICHKYRGCLYCILTQFRERGLEKISLAYMLHVARHARHATVRVRNISFAFRLRFSIFENDEFYFHPFYRHFPFLFSQCLWFSFARCWMQRVHCEEISSVWSVEWATGGGINVGRAEIRLRPVADKQNASCRAQRWMFDV